MNLKNKRKFILVTGFLCVILLSVVLIANRLTRNNYALDNTEAKTMQSSPSGVVDAESKPQMQKPQGMDNAVSLAVKNRGKGYYQGECLTEGHLILDTEESQGTVKVYTLASVGWFGFENGIFTIVSGSGAIPTVITFSKHEQGEYVVSEYKEPHDGAPYADSLKKMFPGELWSKVLSAHDYYTILTAQQEDQATAYLQTIGRTDGVSAAQVEKKLPNINVQASNKLLAERTKQKSFLHNCPYWLGTREQIENGARYIYETSQGKTGDGYDLITYRKLKEDGSLVEEKKYKIIGSELQPLN